MPGCNLEKNVDALLKTFRVLLPEQIMQEHAHSIHPNGLRPTQLLVDLLGIEGSCLPHLQFVDGVAWNVVSADQPGLLTVPRVGPGFGPAVGHLWRLCAGHRRLTHGKGSKKDRNCGQEWD